jgi:hypothetical protein
VSISTDRGRTRPSLIQVTEQYAKARTEASHPWARDRERQLRRLSSSPRGAAFLCVDAPVDNLPRSLPKRFLAITLLFFTALAIDHAHSEVEYLHYDNFSVISEPSGIVDEESNEGSGTEKIFILGDTLVGGRPAKKEECVFFDTNTSITWQTPDSMPVLYLYHKCGGRLEISYRDIEGRDWRQSELVALKRSTFAEALAKLAGSSGSDRIADEPTQLAEYAICKGIVPQPPWFKGSCEAFSHQHIEPRSARR